MIEQHVLSIAEHLPIGSTQRGKCPACQGGPKGETSFIVGREPGHAWWKCFRAGCAVHGITGSANLPTSIVLERTRAAERMRPYTRPTYVLNASDRAYFLDRFEIGDVHGEILTTDSDEYILPVLSPRGVIRGHVVRQPVWKGEPRAPRKGRPTFFDEEEQAWKPMPKTVIHPSSLDPLLSWYHPVCPRNEGHLVVVEDQLSAMKVAKEAYTRSVALLGNGLNAEMVRDILKTRPKVVTIALDPGAEGQAQNLAKKWGLYFERTRVVMLEADPKDIAAKHLASELGV
jgi:hypothetical protein